MAFTYSARTALILGGSKGLGLAIARSLAAERIAIALTGRDPEVAREIAATIGAGAKGYGCDTGSLESVDALYRAVSADLEGIDILVLNSGGPAPSSARDVDVDTWRGAFASLFLGPVKLTDLVLPHMIERGFGRILSIISSGVIEPIPNLAVSNAIRPALVGWGKTLASEVAASGITVNAIAPGRIATDRVASIDAGAAKRTGNSIEDVRRASQARIPVGRYGEPDEFAAAALYLASDQASFVTGSVLRVDGGQIQATV